MKLKPQVTIIIVIAIFVIGIAGTSLAGVWATKNTKVPAKFSEGQLAGVFKPADIRGSYTFSEISSLYNVPLKDLSAAFGITEAEGATFKCKDLETKYAGAQYPLGTDSVRVFTAYYLGLPYTPTEVTYLSASAAQILKNNGKMSQEQLTYLNSHIIPVK
jgi:hypothetical protein